jgi:hypothetical protein
MQDDGQETAKRPPTQYGDTRRFVARLFVLQVFLYSLLTSDPNSCRADQEVDAELEEQFRSGVRQIERLTVHLNLRVRIAAAGQRTNVFHEADYSPEEYAQIKSSAGDVVEYTFLREYAIRGDSKLEIGTDERGIDFIAACNPVYSFGLQRKKGAEQYSLGLLEQRGLDPRVEEMINRSSATGMFFILGAWTIDGERLDKLVESEEFQIEKIAEVNQGGTKLVRIDYQRPVTEIRVGKLSYGDCYIVCDPTKQWGLVEYTICLMDKEGKARLKKEVQFMLETINDVPIPEQIDYKYSDSLDKNPRIVENGSSKYEIISTDVPESDFLISDFGFPEPNFSSEYSSRFWYTTILAAVCLIGPWMIRKRRQRT